MARQRQGRILTGIGKGLYPTLILIPLIAVIALGYSLWRDKLLKRALALGIGVPLLLAGVSIAWLAIVPIPGAEWATSLGDKLEYLVEQAALGLACVGGPLLLGGLIGAIALAVRAARSHDMPLGVALLMLGSYVVLLPLFAIVLAAVNPGEPRPLTIIAFAAAYLALPLAFGARAAGFGLKRQGWATAAAALVAVLALFVLAGPILALSATERLGANDGFGGGADLLGVAPPMPGGMVVEEAAVERAALEAPKQAPVPTAAPAVAQDRGAGGQAQQQAAPLLRQFFPETMYWNPDATTDASGRWQAELDMAHTITTWRLTALASAQDGRLGSTTAPLRVFQDFFVDIDLPLALTQGDEVIMSPRFSACASSVAMISSAS